MLTAQTEGRTRILGDVSKPFVEIVHVECPTGRRNASSDSGDAVEPGLEPFAEIARVELPKCQGGRPKRVTVTDADRWQNLAAQT